MSSHIESEESFMLLLVWSVLELLKQTRTISIEEASKIRIGDKKKRVLNSPQMPIVKFNTCVDYQ